MVFFLREEIEICCDVLNKLLAPVPAELVLTQFPNELKAGLQHPEIPVRKLCLAEVCVSQYKQTHGPFVNFLYDSPQRLKPLGNFMFIVSLIR